MREEIKTLIVEAESSVTEFEKEIFVNDRGFYMNAKTMIDDMIENYTRMMNAGNKKVLVVHARSFLKLIKQELELKEE